MKHLESSIKVFHTKEYSRFNMITGNRQLNERKIKKIINDIEDGLDVLRYCPVLVKENKGRLDIIDGQHRFYVSRRLNASVWYILAEDFTLHQIAKVNSNTERWAAKDYINCYVALDNKHYMELQSFLDSYSMPVTSALCLLHAGAPNSSRIKESFEEGKFVAKHASFAREFADLCMLFNYPDRFSRPFMIALHKVVTGKKIAVEELAEKVNADPSALRHHQNYKDYLVNLETIYNKKKQNRTVIF